MNPTATFARFLDCANARDFYGAREAAFYLRGWLDGGGLEPAWPAGWSRAIFEVWCQAANEAKVQGWEVRTVARSNRARFFVTGVNHDTTDPNARAFSWHVDSLARDARYFLAPDVTIDDDAREDVALDVLRHHRALTAR